MFPDSAFPLDTDIPNHIVILGYGYAVFSQIMIPDLSCSFPWFVCIG